MSGGLSTNGISHTHAFTPEVVRVGENAMSLAQVAALERSKPFQKVGILPSLHLQA